MTKKQGSKRYLEARGWYTAGRMVDWTCPQCGANSVRMADACSAPLEEPCPGFQRAEEVHEEFEQNYSAMSGRTYG